MCVIEENDNLGIFICTYSKHFSVREIIMEAGYTCTCTTIFSKMNCLPWLKEIQSNIQIIIILTWPSNDNNKEAGKGIFHILYTAELCLNGWLVTLYVKFTSLGILNMVLKLRFLV